MNITKETIDDLNAVLSIALEKKDYQSRVDKVLQDYRKQANLKGFRPGKAPLGIIKKMYGKPVLVEEINKLVSESISKFLFEEKLNILGEPLPHEEEAKSIDWDHDEYFEFKFDLGMAPEIEVKLSQKDKFPYYNIKIDDKLINRYIDSYTQRFGELVSAEIPEEKSILKADIRQLDENGVPKEEGISVDEASLSIEMVKDDKIKKKLLSLKRTDKLSIDLKKAYPSDVELSSLLKITKEEVENVTGLFEISVHDISTFKNAEVNQELFDKVFGPGNVNSEKEFRAKIAEEAKNGIRQDSDYRFRIDVKEILIKKVKFDLPEDFLKRWLFARNEGKFTMEQIDNDFESFVTDLKWQLIKDKIASDNQINAEEQDMKAAAREIARMQFAQYGMTNLPDEQLEQFIGRMLEKEEDRNNIHSRVMENKIIEHVKATGKLEEKDISIDKFNNLFEK